MIVDLSTYLPAQPSRVAAHLKTSQLLLHVASPIIQFRPCDAAELPGVWEEKTYWVALRLFGVIPLGKQAIVVSFPKSSSSYCMVDDGHSSLVARWQHQITLDPSGSGTLYRDLVIVEAGVLTVFVWAFAQVFYRHRQRRWRQLVARNFDYGDS